MKRGICIGLLSLLVIFGGCRAPLREAAKQSHQESQRVYKETIRDFNEMNATARLGLIKLQIRACIKDETWDDPVQVTTKSGEVVTLSKLDALVNKYAQSMVDSGMLLSNAATAAGWADLEWIYIESRAGFIETAIKDLRKAREEAKAEEKKDLTSQPAEEK